VVVDPYVPLSALMGNRTDNSYLLPAATQLETSGSVTASNRSVQWREKVVEPLFESKTDHEIMYLFAQKFGFADLPGSGADPPRAAVHAAARPGRGLPDQHSGDQGLVVPASGRVIGEINHGTNEVPV
jgi:anaerobic selenocysteine-containing dehydrogenase